MMLPTHALGGMALGLPVALVAPELAPVALGAGFVGGAFPDLDMYVGHRRTLHYPVYYPALAAVAISIAVLAGVAVAVGVAIPTAPAVGAAVFLAAAAAHSLSDVLGGGLELRPWEGTSDRAVYDHHRGRWIAPRRWVRYDGAPEDFLLSVAIAVPLLAVLDGVLRWAVVGTLAVGGTYVVLRRVLPDVAEVLVELLPPPALSYVPDRYREGTADGPSNPAPVPATRRGEN